MSASDRVPGSLRKLQWDRPRTSGIGVRNGTVIGPVRGPREFGVGLAIGIGEGARTTTKVVDADDVQFPIEAVTLYTPWFTAVAPVMTGFCSAELNPLGPVHA